MPCFWQYLVRCSASHKSIIMGDLLELMQEFEKRNNTSISLDLCSDGSGSLKEFWGGDEIKSFENS